MKSKRTQQRIMNRPPIRGTAAFAIFATAWLGIGASSVMAAGKSEVNSWTPRDRSDFTSTKKEGFPLNVNPEIVTATKAELADDDLIMGVVINGEARAYPVNYMNGPRNEVVNDQLGGLPIAPTW